MIFVNLLGLDLDLFGNPRELRQDGGCGDKIFDTAVVFSARSSPHEF